MEHADVALRSCTPETTCYNRCHPREVLSTGTTRHLASPVHAPRGWGACAGGPRSRAWGHRPLPSPNPAASTRCLLCTRLQSPPVRPAPRPVPADRVGICRSGFTAGRALQVAGDTAGYKRGIGTPSPGNKSERMSPWAAGSPERSRSAAHSSLGTWEGRVAHGPAGSPLPISAHLTAPGDQQRLRQGLPLGPDDRRKGRCLLCLISVPTTDTRCGFRPALAFSVPNVPSAGGRLLRR